MLLVYIASYQLIFEFTFITAYGKLIIKIIKINYYN